MSLSMKTPNADAITDLPTDVLICADNLSLVRGQCLLFKDLSFSLRRGQAIHLCGGNGSGKTSLFKVLLGLLPMDGGSLTLLGKAVEHLQPEDYQQLLYLGYQTAVKNELTVLENLHLNSLLFDKVESSDEQLMSALSAVGLGQFRHQLVGSLSAGQKRRVMLARLWLTVNEVETKKSLWLLDEPLTALDAQVIESLRALIGQHLSLGGAVVFTSHQAFTLSHPVQTVLLGGRR